MAHFDPDLRERMVKLGAQARLVELELEKEQIQRILNDGGRPVDTPVGAMPEAKSRKDHWTKRPENFGKLMAMIKKGRRTRKQREK